MILLCENSKGDKMEIGQPVVTTTSVGSCTVAPSGKLVSGGGHWKRPLILVAVDCVLPTYNTDCHPNNNAIVQVCETGQIVFTHTNCLEPVPSKIEVRYFCDGEDVTDKISAETKRNLVQ